VGGGAGGFPPGGCGGSFEVDAGGLGLIGGIVPLGFLDAGAGGLVEEDKDTVCVGCKKELEVLILVGGGAGAFPLDTVTVRSPCLSVVLVLEFSDRGISQIGSQPDVSIRKSS